MRAVHALPVMWSAERRTRLSDWGERDFVRRMDLWLAAAAADRGLNDLGRENVAALALRYAMNRLRLEALVARHPEIEQIALPSPIVVTGLPRSGTTALVTLLASHPTLRSLSMWEAVDPFSDAPPRLRQQRSDQIRDAGVASMPALASLHDFRRHDLADDQELQGLAFGSYALEWHAHVPGWRDHYLSEDQVPVYRYLERAMKALSFVRGPHRWIIKCPQHVEQLRALKAVFPDALLVVTHRPRAAVDRSMSKMIDYIGKHTRARPMPPRYWRDRFDIMAGRYLRDKHLFPDRIEIDLEEWRAEPETTRASIHARANLQP